MSEATIKAFTGTSVIRRRLGKIWTSPEGNGRPSYPVYGEG